ncbi:MAG TPA: serine/threonine protein kinase [Methylomirabilota bacterium]
MYGYSIFGLRVTVTHPLPGLTPTDGSGAWDVVVRLGAHPLELEHAPLGDDLLYVSPDRDEAGRPLLVVRRLGRAELFRLQYADGTDFVVDRPGTNVWVRWPEPWTVDDVATYLLGPVLAFVLRRRGVTCLHASAVGLGERAVALVGPPGAGKSTLAAGFARRGHPALSDDVVALSHGDGRFSVQPGPPRIRLWPDSVQALYGTPDALPRLTPTWDKRFLDLSELAGRHRPQPLPLAAVYLLTARDPAPTLPCMERVSGVESLMALVANTSANYLLDDTMRGQEFQCLSQMVSAVPVRRLVRDDNPALVPTLCDMIVRDVQSRDLGAARV